ncbi:MAG: DUF4442 domain-containing protein [Proteobacteria bacterium]|nr:DUF4442 domain-containing protein [Pseudomonadota bacterium]
MTSKSATEFILSTWNRLHRLPGGNWLFNCLLRWYIPYSGSIKARVLELKPGYARLELREKRRVRNHLNSVHALALANLGELTSGLALLSGMDDKVRGIPFRISTEYYKKARGILVAKCHVTAPGADEIHRNENMDFRVSADIIDEDGEVVATTVVDWRLAPVKHV